MRIDINKIKELRLLTVQHDALKGYGFSFMEERPPDMWYDHEKEIYDLTADIENKLLEKVQECLEIDKAEWDKALSPTKRSRR